MASRGSVIPLFHDQIISNKKITITDPEMTRFMMTLDDAVDLVLYAFKNGKSGDIFVQKSPASTILEIANALKKIYNSNLEIKIIGTRHSEKVYESLLAREDMINAIDLGDYYKVPADNRDLNYNKYFSQGNGSISEIEDYNSHNTKRLNQTELIELLNKIGYKN